MRRINFIIVVVLVFIIFTGCSNEKKLSNLGYSEASSNLIVNEVYVTDIINNGITSSEFNDMKSQKYYSENYLGIYCNLIKRVYTTDEYDIMMRGIEVADTEGINLDELIQKDTDVIRNEINILLKPIIEIKEKITVTNKNKGDEYLKKYVNVKSFFDGDITKQIENTLDFDSSKLGSQSINITVIDSYGYKNEVFADIEVVDNQKPQIDVGEDLQIFKGEEIDLFLEVSAIDNYDGDVTNKIKVLSEGFDNSEPGNYQVKYEVTDSSGNKASAVKSIEVIDIYEIGETFELYNYKITINSFKFNKKDSDQPKGFNIYYTADDGQTYLILSMKLKNEDDIQRKPFDGSRFEEHLIRAELIYDNRYIYDYELHKMANNWSYTFYYIKPLTYKIRNLTFEIPKEIQNSNKSIILKVYKHADKNDCVYIRVR